MAYDRILLVLLLTASAALPADVLVENVRIASPERDAATAPANVLILGGEIAAIGADLAASEGTATVDGRGRYLSPGLIDGHTHLGEVHGMNREQEAAFPEIAREARAAMPRAYLYHGFTTVVDLNGQPDTIARWNAREVRPQAYFCGPAPLFDGYPLHRVPPEARARVMPYALVDPARADELPAGVDAAEHTPAASVARMKADGAICVKTHYEPGFGPRRSLPVPTVGMIRDLVAAARAEGMPVLLHANSQAGHAFGVEAGVQAFAHGMWRWSGVETGLPPEAKGVIEAAVEHGIALQPTIQVIHGERDLFDPSYLDDPALRAVLPARLIEWYRSEAGQAFRNEMLEIPYVAEALERGGWEALNAAPLARVNAATSYFAERGGRLLFGSDTPSDLTYANPPGLNARQEMRNWAALGVGPAELFRAMTIENAEFFGLAGRLGTVEVGKAADLLLLTKNPFEDPSAFDSIESVIVAGTLRPRETLSAVRASARLPE